MLALQLLALLALPACIDLTTPSDGTQPRDSGKDTADTDSAGEDTDTGSDTGSDTDTTDTDTDGDTGTDTGAGGVDSEDSGGPDSGGEDSAGEDTAGTDPAEVAWSCDAWGEPVSVGTVSDGGLAEISDIVPSRLNAGVLWVLEDSGGEPEVYALDTTGATIGTLRVDGVSNHDWEDLAIAPCPTSAGDCIWIGDTGDNGLSRDDVTILVVPEPTVSGTFATTVTPISLPFRFPSSDGRGNVEGVAVADDGLPVLVTKRVDGTADVYRFPSVDPSTTVTLDHVARITTGDASDEHPAEATSADLLPDGSRLLVRTYDYLLEYPLVAGVPGSSTSLPSPDEPQGESAAYDVNLGGVWVTSEGTYEPLWFVPCSTS